ncbi:MAG: hypothetical protein WCI11_19115, partial [Candidatus Methylumidiphilus sp.]
PYKPVSPSFNGSLRNISDLIDVLPSSIRTPLKTNNILFLGYKLGYWYQRVFFQSFWGEDLQRPKQGIDWWPVQEGCDKIEERLWKQYNRTLYEIPLQEFIQKLEKSIEAL